MYIHKQQSETYPLFLIPNGWLAEIWRSMSSTQTSKQIGLCRAERFSVFHIARISSICLDDLALIYNFEYADVVA